MYGHYLVDCVQASLQIADIALDDTRFRIEIASQSRKTVGQRRAVFLYLRQFVDSGVEVLTRRSGAATVRPMCAIKRIPR